MAIQFNLLPWRDELRAKKEKSVKTSLGIAAITGLALGGLYYGYEKIRLGDHNAALAQITRANQDIQPQIKEKRELDALKIKLNNQIDAIEALQADRASAAHMLEELSDANNQDLFLTEFTLRDGNVNITGIAKNDTEISDLMKKLRASQWYQEPRLINITSAPDLGEEVKTFNITSQLLLPGREQTGG